jgi:hypothetical protein
MACPGLPVFSRSLRDRTLFYRRAQVVGPRRGADRMRALVKIAVVASGIDNANLPKVLNSVHGQLSSGLRSFVDIHADGEVAPIPAVRVTMTEPPESTLKSHSGHARRSSA